MSSLWGDLLLGGPTFFKDPMAETVESTDHLLVIRFLCVNETQTDSMFVPGPTRRRVNFVGLLLWTKGLMGVLRMSQSPMVGGWFEKTA